MITFIRFVIILYIIQFAQSDNTLFCQTDDPHYSRQQSPIAYEDNEPNSNGTRRKKFHISPIYPNPASNICHLSIDWYEPEAKINAELRIYNLKGYLVKDVSFLINREAGELKSEVEIPVTGLSDGMYLIVLSGVGALQRSRPLIIIKSGTF